ncbi:precorrin-6A/cobalt-precorrin-6A reductase [Primorskyibacter sp. 2E107]
MSGIVIIGGAAEARDLAAALPDACVRLTAHERVAQSWTNPLSHGPVTADWLRATGARAVIEAAHPCDAATAFAAARAAAQLGLPRLQLLRPPWQPGPRDRWTALPRPEAAGHVIPASARVLITLGRAELSALRPLRATALVRRIGPAPTGFPLRRGRYLRSQGPFTVAHEIALLRRNRIDWLLLRNAGGPGGWPKLAAARHLGLPVAMVDRPRRPGGPRVQTIEEALAWLPRL